MRRNTRASWRVFARSCAHETSSTRKRRWRCHEEERERESKRCDTRRSAIVEENSRTTRSKWQRGEPAREHERLRFSRALAALIGGRYVGEWAVNDASARLSTRFPPSRFLPCPRHVHGISMKNPPVPPRVTRSQTRPVRVSTSRSTGTTCCFRGNWSASLSVFLYYIRLCGIACIFYTRWSREFTARRLLGWHSHTDRNSINRGALLENTDRYRCYPFLDRLPNTRVLPVSGSPLLRDPSRRENKFTTSLPPNHQQQNFGFLPWFSWKPTTQPHVVHTFEILF